MRSKSLAKCLAWLLILMQLMAGTALADTTTQGTAFTPAAYVGGYTVRFLDESGTEIEQMADVAYETPMSSLLEALETAHPEYANALWSVTGDYLVLNNVDVFMQQATAVAKVDDALYGTLQAAIDAEETVDGSTILLLANTQESIDTKGKSFTLDMGGHTLTAQAGVRAYTQTGGTVEVQQGTITGADITGVRGEPGKGAGMYVSGGTLTARYMTICGNTSNYEGGGLYGTNATVALESCTVRDNTALSNGGAGIAMSKDATLMATGTTVSSNSLSKGMGTALYIACDAELTNCTITGNQAGTLASGAVYVTMYGSLNASGLVIANNTAASLDNGSGGGGLDVQGRAVLGADCRVENNTGRVGGISVSYDASFKAVDGLIVSGNTGSIVGGMDLSGSNIEIANAQILNNTDLSGSYGAGGVLCDSADGLRSCVFRGNKGPVGALSISTPSAGDMSIISCTFEDNIGTNTAGAIHCDVGYNWTSYKYQWAILTGNTITGNTGAKTGGIYVEQYGMLYAPNEGNQIYGNTSKDGMGGNDLVVEPSCYAYVPAASQMGNGAARFEDYVWIGGVGTETIDTKMELNTWSNADNVRYTAGVVRYVAQNLTKAEQPTYITLQEAINAADAGDTIALIAEDKDGTAIAVSESASVDKALTLDLNGRELHGVNGAALTIAPDARLTLTGEGQVHVAGDGYAVINQGELILETGADIAGIDHQGSLLQANCAISVAKVALGEGKVMTGGSQLSAEAVEFVLTDAALQRVNEGWKSKEDVRVALIVPMQEDQALDTALATAATVRGMNGLAVIEMDESGSVIAHAIKINGVYVDGQAGSDDNSGLTPDAPVKTFQQARAVLEAQLDDPNLTEAAKADLAGIYVMGRIIVADAQTWSLPDGKRLIRYPDYKGSLAEVNGSLTLRDIAVDGSGRENVEAASALVVVRGTLNIEDGAALENNRHTAGDGNYVQAGGAVFCDGGTVNMSGGRIAGNTSWYGGGICLWNGSLYMTGGSISGNSAQEANGRTPIGGGVALLMDAKMTMNGGAVSGNSSGSIGGGICVGGVVSSTVGSAALSMNGGTVSGNTAESCGGGIYIQAEAEGHIDSGSITNNVSKSGFFGGGGIYVNGSRTVDGTTFDDGKLYLRDVIITANTSQQDGGGLAGCGSSTTKIYVSHGGAIYGNEGSTAQQIYIDASNLGGYGRNPFAMISAYMLDGTPYNWSLVDGRAATADMLSSINTTMRLNNPHTDETAAAARQMGRVWITGNSAATRGGGIGSNGYVQIGVMPTEGEWTPEGDKTLTGRDMSEGEFTFEVREGDTLVSTGYSQAAKDGEAAQIVFTAISFDGETIGTKHTYTITEKQEGLPGHVVADQRSFTIEVTVAEGPDGRLTGVVSQESPQVSFENNYPLQPTDVTLAVTKQVSGDVPGAKDFTFLLAADESNSDGAAMPEAREVTINGSGSAQFGAIHFTKPGTFVFEIRERDDQEPGYTYDSSVWTVTVVVADVDAQLTVQTVTYAKDGQTVDGATAAAFSNGYSTVPTTLAPVVRKHLTGEETPEDKTFTFRLTAMEGNPAGATLPESTEVTVTGEGSAAFDAITFTKAGRYLFQLHEVKGQEPGYTYDSSVWTLSVVVEDLDSRLTVTSQTYTRPDSDVSATEATFVNSYHVTEAAYTPSVLKGLMGATPPERATFWFDLTAAEDNPAGATLSQTSASVSGAGKASFGPITFTKRGTYRFTISERQGSDDGYTYDGSVWTLTVQVQDDGGKLSIQSVAYTGASGVTRPEDAAFINSYEPAETSVEIVGQKTVQGAPQTSGDFTFVLTPVNSLYPMPATAQNGAATVSVHGAGMFSFGTIRYTQAGQYAYLVTETAGSELGYTYDGTVYTVTVDVTDVGGRLEASVRYASGGKQADKAYFTNVYEVGSLTIEKEVVGANKTRAFTFTLLLKDASGALLTGTYPYVGTNGAPSGMVSGGKLTFQLKHNQSIRVDGLPVGVTYTVEETAHTGYTVISENAQGTITATSVTAGFTNIRKNNGDIPKTGYGETNTRYWLLGGCLLIALLAGIGRRKLRPADRRK